MSPTAVDRFLVERAGQRLRAYVRQTALICDPTSGIWVKCENEQITGSFKLRGALNRCLLLTPDELGRGIVAASAGNHGQGVAYAARLLGARATIVVPADAVPRKIDGIRALGAHVQMVEGGYAVAESEGHRVAAESGAVWISPYNDAEVVAGQGTVGLEIEEQWEPQSTDGAEVYVPVGGGGLVAGIGAALAGHRPRLRVIGVLPENSPYLHAFFHTGSMAGVVERPTLADGLSGSVEVHSITLSLVREYVDDMILIPESEIRSAMRWARDRAIVAEPSAAVALAACLRRESGTRLAVVSGGNVDPGLWEEVGLNAQA